MRNVMEIRWTAVILTAAWICGRIACVPSSSTRYYTPSTTSRRRWTIAKTPCEGVQGETGVCMFNWDCIRKDGTVLSTCMDGFLLGACCKLPDVDKPTTTLPWSDPNRQTTQRPLAYIDNTTAYGVTLSDTPGPVEHDYATTRRPTSIHHASTASADLASTVTSYGPPQWPFVRLPTATQNPTTSHSSSSASPHSHSAPGLPSAQSYLTSWATTRPSIIFTPTRYFMRPTIIPTTYGSPAAQTTYAQRPPLTNLLASTPLGMLGSLLSRPFVRPSATTTPIYQPATGRLPPTEQGTSEMQSDAPRVSTHVPIVPEPTVANSLAAIVSQLSSHSVSRLPSTTLNTIDDLTFGTKHPEVRLTTKNYSDYSTTKEDPSTYLEFVDLTEVSTPSTPSTAAMEYTLDVDTDKEPTVTHSTISAATAGPTFGEVVDVSVTQLGSVGSVPYTVSSHVYASSTGVVPTLSSPKITTPSTTTGRPTFQQASLADTQKPTAIKFPVIANKPSYPPALNTVQTISPPVKFTSHPSTIFKFPFMTTVPTRLSTATVHSSHHPPGSFTARPLTTMVPNTKRKKPHNSTATGLFPTVTSSIKIKGSPKPVKPVLSQPSHGTKPDKPALPTKSSTKKSTTKPLVTKTTITESTKLPATQPSSANRTTATTEASRPRWDYRKHCGVRPLRPQGRIVGGRNSFFGEWPWQVLVKEATWLGLFVKNKCGGVLISRRYALTAAHCQPGFLSSLLVVLGEHDLSGDYETLKPVSIPVRRMIVHRNYNPSTFENDLALLELERPVEFKPHIVPICLPERNEDFTGRTSYVTGWGKLSHGGSVPNVLQYVQVPILSNGRCQKMFKLAGHVKSIRENFVCAGYDHGNRDSCEGDSGGPLTLLRDDGRWVLVGTVSHGIRCAEPNMPGVYMRTSAYRPWIDSVINPK